MDRVCVLSFAMTVWAMVLCASSAAGGVIRGEVVDADTGRVVPARVYIRAAGGGWHFAKSAAAGGSAVEYRVKRFANCVEMHTTLSAHPFLADVPAGRYTLRAERGKECLPAERTVEVAGDPVKVKLALKRWIDMSAAGWYSGDTHVHRTVAELRNLLPAEDLNIALPLTYWVTVSHRSPLTGRARPAKPPAAEPIAVDATHVIWPVNTEYEIFQTAGRRHTLGAVFVLGHNRPFDFGTPPVAPIAERARKEGALLDLDKHSWPWSLMLVPVMNVDLFELANNHLWRTEFGFRQWGADVAPEYMKLERDRRGLTEWGWIDFGFQTYYALLNCGFRLRVTAGTASGVHPVPLGFGRVYVHLPGGFSYAKWMAGLDAGRSFVTTGPMLTVRVADRPAGATLRLKADGDHRLQVTGRAVGPRPLRAIEVIVNGEVAARVKAENRKTERGGYECPLDVHVRVGGSSWVAVRAFEDRPDKRVRFAHSGPVHVEVPGKPLRPRRVEAEYFVRRMKQELKRNEKVLKAAELAEYRQALAAYEACLSRARQEGD